MGGGSGHLSNEQAAGAAVEMAKQGVRRILLGHLSENNNLPCLAVGAVAGRLRGRGCTDISVAAASQYEISEVYEVK